MKRKRKAELGLSSTTDIQGFKVPQNKKDMERLWNQAQITSIHDMEQGFLGFGSKVTQRQFIALRIIFPKVREAKDLSEKRAHKATYGLLSTWDHAITLVQACPEFQAYFQLIPNNVRVTTVRKSETNRPETLKPTRLIQEQISKASTEVREQEPSLNDRELRSRTRQPTKVAKLVEAQHTERFVKSMQISGQKLRAIIYQASSTSDSSDESTKSHDSDESYFDSTEFPEARNEGTT